MIEGHLSGLSFTYEPVKHHAASGRPPRAVLDEVKVFEATVTPFPMDQFALCVRKRRVLRRSGR